MQSVPTGNRNGKRHRLLPFAGWILPDENGARFLRPKAAIGKGSGDNGAEIRGYNRPMQA